MLKGSENNIFSVMFISLYLTIFREYDIAYANRKGRRGERSEGEGVREKGKLGTKRLV
jgi:hypothetical protein